MTSTNIIRAFLGRQNTIKISILKVLVREINCISD